MELKNIADQILDKVSGKTTINASRKSRDIISLLMSIIMIVFFAYIFLLLKLKFELLFNDFHYNDKTTSSINLFRESFINKLTLYYFIGVLLIIGIYLITVYFISEIYLSFNKYGKKLIFKNRLNDYEFIDRKTVKLTFLSTLILVVLFLIYFVNLFFEKLSYAFQYGSELSISDFLSPILILATLTLGSTMLIQNYYLIKSKFKKKKKLERLIINYNLISVIFYASLFILILNVWLPLIFKGFNYSIDFLFKILNESLLQFKSYISANGLDFNSIAIDNFDKELLRILELKFDINTVAFENSSLILYLIVILFSIIIILPKLYSIGWKKSLVIILALIIGSFISELFVKYLYVNENTSNNLFVYILVYFVLTFAINELSDLFKDKLSSKKNN